MLKNIFLVLFTWLSLACVQLSAHAVAVPEPLITGRAYMLFDLNSQQILAQKNAEQMIDPASLTKLMTAYLVFDALRERRLSLQQTVIVSENAWRVDPSSSKMFIEPGDPVTVEELLYGLIVQSGNDASVALAEAVAGSEANFAELMNRQAKRLGMNNTHFSNPHGLPMNNHYSSARDLIRLVSHLIEDFPQHYARFYSTKEYTYNGISQFNRNRLLWLDSTVDGVKTGHTKTGGYSLIASAVRTQGIGANAAKHRLISIVIGTDTEMQRVLENQKLLNWGFQNFDVVKLYSRNKAIATPTIWKGSRDQIAIGFNRDTYVSLPKGLSHRIKLRLARKQPLVAPISAGTVLGQLQVRVDEQVIAELPVVALENVAQAGLFGQAWDGVRLWLQN